MNTKVVPFIEQVSSIDTFENNIRKMGEDEPHKAYIMAHAIGKMTDGIKKDFQEGFRNYYDTQKELPAGFDCKVVNGSKKYNFEDDLQWSQIKATLEARESLLKQATDLHDKGGVFTDPNTGEIIEPVTYSYSATQYRLSRK